MSGSKTARTEKCTHALTTTETDGWSKSAQGTALTVEHSTTRFYFVFTCLLLLGFIASLMTTSTSTSLTSIGDALSLSFTETFWIPTSGALTAAIFQPICLTLASVYGKKAALATSAVLFTLGSILSGTAHHYPVMVTGSSLRGIGVGGIITCSDMMVADAVPLLQRGKWMSLLSTSWGLGIALGPIVGGLLAHAQTWRWIFLMNAPACLPITAGILLMLPEVPQSRSTRLALIHVDFPGIVMLISSTSAILIPCMQAQTVESWTNWQVYLPIICGVLILCAFFSYETRVAGHPLIPLQIFNNRASILALLCAMVHSLTLWSILFFLPFYFEVILEFSPSRAGLAILTQSLSSACITVVTGIAISRSCRYRWAIWAGWALTTAGYGLLSLLDDKSTPSSWIPINLIAGLGAGMLFISMNIAIQTPVAKENVATALTMHTFVRALGSVFGLAMSTAVFQARLKHGLDSSPVLRQLVHSLGAKGNLMSHLGLLNVSAQKNASILMALNEAYISSLRMVWVTIAALAGSALLVSLAIPSHSLVEADPRPSKSFEATDEQQEV